MQIGWDIVQQTIKRRFPEVRSTSTHDLADWLNQTERPLPLLLDVRTADEYAVSHLPQAQRLEPNTQDFSALADLPLDTPIVTYCSVGMRSAAIASQLQANGFTNVTNLEGSIFRWVNEGRAAYRNDQPVQQVHPYNSLWGLLLRHPFHAYTP
ncbi:rhodanese-like domain-containing protein [Oculatella sp. LEGE 06141]|uniref:rhodanese-like domain-containing protein n=1 Tax=Oculatella sp. LEGE 06141 TaxID=1828648 RepID=UPI001D158637|nr:rhodanese-like domain-containing protein [Oculatella sp. LEGE 06141]